MKYTVKMSAIVFIVITLLLSCSDQSTYLEDITIYDVRVRTTFDEITIIQEGISVLIPSNDFDVNTQYSVTLSSPDNTYQWEKQISPVLLNKRKYLFFNDILMPSNMSFPSGVYSLQIFQEDTTFIETSMEYHRELRGGPIEDINLQRTPQSDEIEWTFDEQENYLYSITIYGEQKDVLFQQQDVHGTIVTPDGVGRVLIVANNEKSSTIDVYRYVYSY